MTINNERSNNPSGSENPRIYPGLAGGTFERFVSALDQLEQMPTLFFVFALGLLAWLIRPAYESMLMMAFFIGDILIIASLPKAGISFGRVKPQVLVLAVLRVPFALLPRPMWWMMQTIGTLLALYAFRIEPARIRLRNHQLTKSAGTGKQASLRIFHFGDLHIERVTDRERQVISWIGEYKPDLVLFSGDVFSYSNVDDRVAWEQARDLLEEIRALSGAFAVLGSPPVDVPEVIVPLYEGLPIRLLINQSVMLEHDGKSIELIGLSCSHNPKKDHLELRKLLRETAPDLRILLYHSPDLAPSAAGAGIDIQFSGHTHGGQVRLPFFGALITSSLCGKRFESGRYQLGDMTLYVTRGIGLEGRGAPRVRFLCPPECSLWEVHF